MFCLVADNGQVIKCPVTFIAIDGSFIHPFGYGERLAGRLETIACKKLRIEYPTSRNSVFNINSSHFIFRKHGIRLRLFLQ